MEELLSKLIERDMILATDEEAQELVAYANEQGYFAKYFSYRKRPNVSLKRKGPGSIEEPLRISTMSIEECNEKIQILNSELENIDRTSFYYSIIRDEERIEQEIRFYKSVIKRLQN